MTRPEFDRVLALIGARVRQRMEEGAGVDVLFEAGTSAAAVGGVRVEQPNGSLTFRILVAGGARDFDEKGIVLRQPRLRGRCEP